MALEAVYRYMYCYLSRDGKRINIQFFCLFEYDWDSRGGEFLQAYKVRGLGGECKEFARIGVEDDITPKTMLRNWERWNEALEIDWNNFYYL